MKKSHIKIHSKRRYHGRIYVTSFLSGNISNMHCSKSGNAALLTYGPGDSGLIPFGGLELCSSVKASFAHRSTGLECVNVKRMKHMDVRVGCTLRRVLLGKVLPSDWWLGGLKDILDLLTKSSWHKPRDWHLQAGFDWLKWHGVQQLAKAYRILLIRMF